MAPQKIKKIKKTLILIQRQSDIHSKAVKHKDKIMEKYLRELQLYFKIKKKYDSKNKKLKQAIFKKDISWEEKRHEFNRRVTCLLCKKRGGTDFSYQDGVYTAVCGSDSPCELHLELKRPKVVFIPDKINELYHLLQFFKQIIIQKKLNLIFGLEDEATVAEDFNSFRNDYRANNNLYQKLIHDFDELLDMEAKNIRINNAKQQFYAYVEQMKQLLTEYDNDDETAKLQASIELYIHQIMPLLTLIRENECAICEVIEDSVGTSKTTFYRLVKKKITYAEQEYIEENPKVIKFINKRKRVK